MATGSLATACHSRVIEGRGIGKRGRRMARAAILIRRYMRGCFAKRAGDAAVMAGRTQLPSHFRTSVIEGAPGKRRRCRGITRVTARAITRCRHVVLYFPGCSHPIMACRTGQSLVYAAHFQCRVVEARRKAAAGLVALLAHIRRRRVCRAFADGLDDIACDMTTHALLSLDGRILMVDRIGFLEITCRRVTRVAFPAVGIHGGMHGVTWMAPGKIDRIVVGSVVATTAARCVGRMYRVHKRARLRKATYDRTIDARTVVRVRVALAAIIRRGNVTRRLRDHRHAVMRFAIMATGAILRDARGNVVESWQ